MTMQSPIAAMLWELWRLTRVEAAGKLALGTVGGLAVLVVLAATAGMDLGDVAFDGEPPTARAARDAGAVIALFLIVFVNIVGWWSIGNLNRLRPGFPFYLLYTRPVRTAVLVGVPMAFLAAVPAASYLVSALLLKVTSGYQFPLVPVAAWIAAVNLAHAPTNWPIRNTVVKLAANMAVGLAWVTLAGDRLTAVEIPGWDWPPNRWATIFDFPLTDYALIAAVGLASFGVTVAGVARQRRGDAPATPWTDGVIGFPDWLATPLRFICPTSSATRAQVWFDLHSRGLPVLTTGLVLATVNPLLFALSVPVASIRPFAVMCGILSVLAVLGSGRNAFGIRWRQGHGYASAFEATQPSGTARLAGLKVLVRSLCVLVALVAVGVSVWASLSFIAVGEGYEPLRSWQRAIEMAVEGLTGGQRVALAVVASISVTVMVASLAALTALTAHYPRRQRHPGASAIGIAGWLLLLHGFLLVPLVLTGYRGVGSVALWEFLLDALVWVTRWIDAPAIVLATVYVTWRAFAERLLTLRSAGGAVLVSAAFAAAWVTVLQAAGVQFAGMPTMNAVWMLSPALLPLMASAVAPWSLSRIRHK